LLIDFLPSQKNTVNLQTDGTTRPSSSIKQHRSNRPLSGTPAGLGLAHADDQILQRILVDGSRTNQLAWPMPPAPARTQQELAARTVYRPGEMLEAVPGLIVSQHSGEGKANQFYLRGFNLDHGTDLRTTVDGMPVNQRSHAHGQGWTDLNFLIPELAVRLDYKKGPTPPRKAISLRPAPRRWCMPTACCKASPVCRRAEWLWPRTGGRFGGDAARQPAVRDRSPAQRRPVHASGRLPETECRAALQRRLCQQRLQCQPDGLQGRLERHRPDSTARRAGRSAATTPSTTATAARRTVTACPALAPHGEDSASSVNAYIIANQLDLWSNFTYFMEDPVHGDQFAQPDKRVTSGLNASHSWHQHTDTGSSETTVGVQLQNDNIFNGSTARRRAAAVDHAAGPHRRVQRRRLP
jgi:hypothetical protein